MDAMRIDKWLWAARFFKTRSVAQEAVGLGRVRALGGQRMKASRDVKVGDTLEIDRGDEHFVVVVKGLSSVRGPAPVAQTLYEETAESLLKRTQKKDAMKVAFEPAHAIPKGRPTKRDRRRMEAVSFDGFDD